MNTQQQPTINLADLAKEIVEGQGYILLPNLLNTAEATEARNIVLKLADQERKQEKVITERFKERLYGLIYKGEIFAKMVQHPRVLSVIEAILGEDIVLGGFSAHILHPGAQRMGVHVDYPYWAMSPPYPQFPVLEVQVIWLVEDFTEDNGAPLFVAGSQKLATKPDLDKFEQQAQKITATAGTAIISHGLCWHDTSVNSSDKPRVSILGNYTPQYIHSLEDNLFDFQSEVIDRATPKLRQLLRHDLKSLNKPVFEIKFKLND